MDPNNDKQLLFAVSAFIAKRLTSTVPEMLEEHKRRLDRCPEFQTLNKATGYLKGKEQLCLKIKPQPLVDLFNKAGYPYYTTSANYKGDVVPHLTPCSESNRELLMQTVQRSCAPIINKKLRHYLEKQRQKIVGVQYYGDTYTPEVHILCEPIPNEDKSTTPMTMPTQPHKRHDDKDDEYQLALDPASHNHIKAEHMLQARLEQEANNDDKPKEPKPVKPFTDDNLSRQHQQQVIRQQVEAVNDDDDDNDNNYKKRNQRQQQRRNRQRQSQQQTATTNSNLSPEWQRVVDKQLAREEAEQYALKHPTTTRKRSGGGHNGQQADNELTPFD